jgi:hypothetical protein
VIFALDPPSRDTSAVGGSAITPARFLARAAGLIDSLTLIDGRGEEWINDCEFSS